MSMVLRKSSFIIIQDHDCKIAKGKNQSVFKVFRTNFDVPGSLWHFLQFSVIVELQFVTTSSAVSPFENQKDNVSLYSYFIRYIYLVIVGCPSSPRLIVKFLLDRSWLVQLFLGTKPVSIMLQIDSLLLSLWLDHQGLEPFIINYEGGNTSLARSVVPKETSMPFILAILIQSAIISLLVTLGVKLANNVHIVFCLISYGLSSTLKGDIS